MNDRISYLRPRYGNRFALALGFLVLVTCIACRGPQAGPTGIDEARSILEDSLKKWSEGKSLADMRSLQPPIYVAEDLWLRGDQLTQFSIKSAGQLVGTNVRFEVEVRTRPSNGGAETTRSLKYLIASSPAISIARED
jgi:hypothetical protein